MKRFLIRIVLPWSVTGVALYFAFHDIEWKLLINHIASADPKFLAAAVVLTVLSYICRAERWRFFFPQEGPRFADSFRVLILGFFMNNVLPARAGEFVRAHLGGRVTGRPRTLVLATIANERLADGLTVSLLFAGTISFFGRGFLDPDLAHKFMYVAYLFMAVAAGVIAVLLARIPIFKIIDKIRQKSKNRAFLFTLQRITTFIDGLSPLTSIRRAPAIWIWSCVVWGLEFLVYASILEAYGSHLPAMAAVIFMVAVNFSGLIPAAPGGFGVIELVAKKVLVSTGVPSDELALAMVLTQHLIQYVIVGIPGAVVLATWRKKIEELPSGEKEGSEEYVVARTLTVNGDGH